MSLIASASEDLKFHQWPDGLTQQTYVPAKNDGHIKSVSWAKDGSWLVLVPHSGPAEIIGIKDSVKLLQTIEEVEYPTCATFQNSTKKLVAVGTLSGHVLVYDIKSKNIKKRFPRAYSMISQLQYNTKDTHLAAACANGEIIVFNSMTLNSSSTYRVPRSSSVSILSFHRFKRNLLTAGSDEGIVAVWDINTNSLLLDIQAHHAPITALAFSPLRSDILVTAGLDRRFAFYDVVAKKCILDVNVRNSVTALDYSQCGTYLGVGSQSGAIILYDTRNLKDPISAFTVHEGKRIYHLLFQKALMSKDEQENSIINITGVSAPHKYQEEECNVLSIDSLNVCEDYVSVCDEGENNQKVTEEVQDSFLMELGIDGNSMADSEMKESGVNLGITEGVKKWMDSSKHSFLHQNSTHQMQDKRNSTQTVRFPSGIRQSVSKQLQEELHNANISPILPSAQKMSPKSLSSHNNGTINSTPLQAPHISQPSINSDELKRLLREVVKEEVGTQLDSFKNEMRIEFAETLGHMRRHFLDLQLSVVKEFVNMEGALEKMGNVTVKEFLCDDFLLNQNKKLLKELDLLKEQMVERDQCKRKF